MEMNLNEVDIFENVNKNANDFILVELNANTT